MFILIIYMSMLKALELLSSLKRYRCVYVCEKLLLCCINEPFYTVQYFLIIDQFVDLFTKIFFQDYLSRTSSSTCVLSNMCR